MNPPIRRPLALALTLAACTTPKPPGARSVTAAPAPAAQAPPQAIPSASSLCDHVVAGGPSQQAPELGLSALHAGLRFFGTHHRYADVDRALVAALSPDRLPDQVELGAYARALDWTCALSASAATLGPARVIRVGRAAVVHPGLGDVRFPEDAEVVVLDLRGLPDVPELGAALDHATAPALATPITREYSRRHRHHGLGDEVWFPTSEFGNDVTERAAAPLTQSGTRDLPIAVVTDDRMPAAAAELAGTLRLSRRAWLFGADVLAGVAETRWAAVGSRGLVWRYEDLLHDGERWPDVIPADGPARSPEEVVAALSGLGQAPPIHGTAVRAPVERFRDYWDDSQAEIPLGVPQLEAALLIAHGAARDFFSYLDVTVPAARVDARLTETLGLAQRGEASDEVASAAILRRFGESLAQQHQRVWRKPNAHRVQPVGAYLDYADGQALVRHSLVEALRPGDAVVAMDGRPIGDFFAERGRLQSAANEGSRFAGLMRDVVWRSAVTTYTLRNPAGETREVTLTPDPKLRADPSLSNPSLRAEGWLADLGAPTIYYINLSGDVLRGEDQLAHALDETRKATGLVLDMRGYPGTPANDCLLRVAGTQLAPYRYLVREWLGPDESQMVVTSVTGGDPLNPPAYSGPIALLVGPETGSWGESIALGLADRHRAVVVGRRTAGDDGADSGVQLPGGYRFSFTASQVEHEDGRRFEGEGIAPDVPVAIHARDFAAGLDPELDAAVRTLRKPSPRAKRLAR